MTFGVLGKDKQKESNQRVDLTREGAQSIVSDVYFPRRSHVTLAEEEIMKKTISANVNAFLAHCLF